MALRITGMDGMWRALAFGSLSLFVMMAAADPIPATDDGALRFDINSITVEGASLLNKAEIDAVVAPYIGKRKDFSDVQRALESVESAYAARGYSAVQVMLPEQELENGRIRFRAVESHFDQVVVKGQKFSSEIAIRNALPSVRQGNAPRSSQIARELKLANENPARQLNVVLKAGKQENMVDAEVQVQDEKPESWGISLDNTGSAETGQSRLSAYYRHANLMRADHVGTVQIQISPQKLDSMLVLGGAYKIPLYASGDSVEFFGGYSNVNSLVGGLSNFQGGGMLFNARYNQSLERVAGFDPHLYYGFDWRYFKSIKQTKPTTQILNNEIVVTPLTLGLAAGGRSGRSETAFDVGYSRNVPMSSRGKKDSFAEYVDSTSGTPVFYPDVNYSLVRYSASHAMGVGEDMQLRAALNGQWTRSVLILGEQMRLGGMNAVRGFSEGTEAGETGVRGSLEFYSPGFAYSETNTRALVFFDAGKVHSDSGLKSSINSFGFGLRGNWRNVAYRLDAGRIGKAGSDPLQQKGDWRLHASVSAAF